MCFCCLYGEIKITKVFNILTSHAKTLVTFYNAVAIT